MIIKSIRLKNFMRYRGETILNLEPTIYAIVAESERDSDRSNWVGKSSLMESIVFGLYGRKPPRCVLEDDWITRGESIGEVELTFDDGTSILRSRTRNKATRSVYDGATQEGADRRLYEHLGLSEEDFLATCYFEQRQMAKFVLSKPSQRQEMISGWFGLDKLEAACEMAKLEIPALTSEKHRIETEIAKLTAKIEIEVLTQEQIDSIQESLKFCELAIDSTKIKLHEIEKVEALHRLIKERDEVISKGKLLAKTMGQEVSSEEALDLRNQSVQIQTELNSKQTRYRDLKVLASGRFDGICPLIRKSCPSHEFVNATKNTLDDELSELARSMSELSQNIGVLRSKENELLDLSKQYERGKALLDDMRKRVKQLNEQIGKDPVPELMDKSIAISDLMALQTEANQYKFKLKEDLEKHHSIEVTKPIIQKYRDRLLEIDSLVLLHMNAVRLLGRNCAQRKIAESNLDTISDGANDLLQMCGLDLNVGISWAREGKGLAKNCDACGYAFGASAKVKTCVCGVPRGLEQISRLDVVLSDRSGAAEDLAGCAFQLSAASWLRSNRNALWSVALLDECFGSLDAYNRKSFARHLVSMLSGKYGFRQAFIISHSPDTTHLFPSRIQLTGYSDRTVATVIG